MYDGSSKHSSIVPSGDTPAFTAHAVYITPQNSRACSSPANHLPKLNCKRSPKASADADLA